MDSLSEHITIDFIATKTPEELRSVLQGIKLPYAIKSMYYAEGKHIAWIIPSLPIRKKIVSKGSLLRKL